MVESFKCPRYGTIPVVRKTGGLNDTVFDVDDDVARAAANGMVTNGYNFEGTDPAGIDYALNRYARSFCLISSNLLTNDMFFISRFPSQC